MNGAVLSPRPGRRPGLGWGMFVVAALVCLPAQAELLSAWVAPGATSEAALTPVISDSAPGFDPQVPAAGAAKVSPPDPKDAGISTEIARGKGSWYGGHFHGRRTASGEKFDMHDLTAAHKTLPFGTRVKVRDLASGREVEVRINDRGPHVRGRIIDLSRAAALALGVLHAGEAAVALLRP